MPTTAMPKAIPAKAEPGKAMFTTAIPKAIHKAIPGKAMLTAVMPTDQQSSPDAVI
jgi:hypothetical protein